MWGALKDGGSETTYGPNKRLDRTCVQMTLPTSLVLSVWVPFLWHLTLLSNFLKVLLWVIRVSNVRKKESKTPLLPSLEKGPYCQQCLFFFFSLSLPFPFFPENMFHSQFVKTSVSSAASRTRPSICSSVCIMCHIFRMPKLVVFHVLFKDELESRMEEQGYWSELASKRRWLSSSNPRS